MDTYEGLRQTVQMSRRKSPPPQYTPVRPGRGRGHVHAVPMSSAGSSACGKATKNWVVALTDKVDCPGCVRAVFYPVRPIAERVR